MNIIEIILILWEGLDNG